MLEFGEMNREGDINVVYRWDMRNDTFSHISEIARLSEMISLYGGFTRAELLKDIDEKSKVLDWMVKNNMVDVDDAGFVMANYYKNREKVMDIVRQGPALLARADGEGVGVADGTDYEKAVSLIGTRRAAGGAGPGRDRPGRPCSPTR